MCAYLSLGDYTSLLDKDRSLSDEVFYKIMPVKYFRSMQTLERAWLSIMNRIHGGDIYRNHVKIDFSVNVNPLGIPESVKVALQKAVGACQEYPDITAEALKSAVSDSLSVPKDFLLFGNGASELFMAVVHALKPEKTVIPIPSFYGYEHAVNAVEGEIVYYLMQENNEFSLKEDVLSVLTEDVQLLFLANPNNPTGKLISPVFLKQLLCHCMDKGIYVVLDECFIDFCESEASMLPEITQFANLILIKAFTKIFAIPGVRLGYLACSNWELLRSIERQLPEWNLSVFAQRAGVACAKEQEYIRKTACYVKRERRFLEEGLKEMGFRVFSGDADFILFSSEKRLYELLLERGILIRDCGNFRGLSKGYYRIAVKSQEENEVLLKTIGELC